MIAKRDEISEQADDTVNRLARSDGKDGARDEHQRQ
jgi:hypothetical protein